MLVYGHRYTCVVVLAARCTGAVSSLVQEGLFICISVVSTYFDDQNFVGSHVYSPICR